MGKINSIIRAYNGVENKQDLIKTVIRTVKKGGLSELKNAAKRSADRDQEARVTDLYEKQQQRSKEYCKTNVKVLFIVLVEQIEADIRNSIESIGAQDCVGKEIVVIAPIGFQCPYDVSVREFDENWGTYVEIVVNEYNVDYIFFLRGGDYYAPNMSGEFFGTGDSTRYDMIYSDECISDEKGRRYFLKPDYSEFDLLYTQYMGQAIAFSREAIFANGGIDTQVARLDDLILDIVLRVSGTANQIKHIDQVLLLHQFDFHESIDGSRIKMLNSALQRCKVKAEAHLVDGTIKLYYGEIKDKFSIIIASDVYENCCNSIDNIMGHTDYVSFEIIVVCSDEVCGKLAERYEGYHNIKFVIAEDNSYTSRCNTGAAEAEGGVIVFMADDARVLQNDWLYRMGTLLAFPKVGAVSPKVIRNENTIRYAGMIAGGFGFTPIPFNGEENIYKSNWNEPAFVTRAVSVLSSTCLLIRKTLFEQMGGLAVGKITDKFSNAILSFEIGNIGAQSVYCSEVAVIAGSQEWYDSKYDAEDPQAYLYLLQNYADKLSYDPYFSEAMKQQYLRGVSTDFRIYKKKMTKDQNKGNILMVSHDALLGGATIALQYAARALNNNGYYVTFLIPKEGGIIQELEKDGIHYIVDSTLYGNGEWMQYAGNYDVVFLNTILLGTNISQLQKFSKRIFWWIHEAPEYYKSIDKSKYRFEVNSMLRVCCVGVYAKKAFAQHFPEISTDILIYGLPDYCRYETVTEIEKSNKIIILSVGTIEKRKGQDILCKAIELLSDTERAKCQFLFIGKKIDDEIYQKIERYQEMYPQTVQILGTLNRKKMMEQYRKCACVICSSREDPMPVFITECMMQSRVAICSENTGTADVLKDGYDGLIYQNNDPILLAEKIRYVISHKDELERMKRNARDTYEKVFAMETFEKKICEVLADFIEQP